MHSLPTLTTQELHLVLAALAATMPHGGGSPTFTLLRKLRAETGEIEPEAMVIQACNTVVDEWKEFTNQL